MANNGSVALDHWNHYCYKDCGGQDPTKPRTYCMKCSYFVVSISQMRTIPALRNARNLESIHPQLLSTAVSGLIITTFSQIISFRYWFCDPSNSPPPCFQKGWSYSLYIYTLSILLPNNGPTWWCSG